MVVVRLTEAAGLTLGLHEGEGVAFLAGALDVADDGTASIATDRLEELDAHLGDAATGASAAEDLDDLAVLGLLGLDDDFFGSGGAGFLLVGLGSGSGHTGLRATQNQEREKDNTVGTVSSNQHAVE